MRGFNDFHIHDLTPVEQRGAFYFKRDDLYYPFLYRDQNPYPIKLGGGKVRQALSILEARKDYIADSCDGHVVVACSAASTQSAAVARACMEYGFSTKIFLGGVTPASIKQNPILMHALRMGARVNIESRSAYMSSIMSQVQKSADYGENFFLMDYETTLKMFPSAVLDSISYQVQNIPDDLDFLIVSCGSGITMGGILLGLLHYNKKVGKVIGIQTAGYDKSATVENILGKFNYPYEFLVGKDYGFSHELDLSYKGLMLDPIYEAKALDFTVKYLLGDRIGGKVLFWVTGDSRGVREGL